MEMKKTSTLITKNDQLKSTTNPETNDTSMDQNTLNRFMPTSLCMLVPEYQIQTKKRKSQRYEKSSELMLREAFEKKYGKSQDEAWKKRARIIGPIKAAEEEERQNLRYQLQQIPLERVQEELEEEMYNQRQLDLFSDSFRRQYEEYEYEELY